LRCDPVSHSPGFTNGILCIYLGTPFLIFKLHGRRKEEIIAALCDKRASNAESEVKTSVVPVTFFLFSMMGYSADVALMLAFGSNLLVVFPTAIICGLIGIGGGVITVPVLAMGLKYKTRSTTFFHLLCRSACMGLSGYVQHSCCHNRCENSS
jgi:uncharacterized membrane protein YfcA